MELPPKIWQNNKHKAKLDIKMVAIPFPSVPTFWVSNMVFANPKTELIAFEMIDRGIPRHDYKIVDANGTEIGIVTSGTQSPSLQKAIGMGYVNTAYTKEESEIFIAIRDQKIKATVVKFPFYKSPNTTRAQVLQEGI